MSDWVWITLALAVGNLAAVGALVIFGDPGGLRRRARLAKRIGARDRPAVITDAAGEILQSNASARAVGKRRAVALGDLLPGLVASADAAMIYRMIRTARQESSAAERVSVAGSAEPGMLSVTALDDDLFLWTLTDLGPRANAALENPDGAGETGDPGARAGCRYPLAPFAHLSQDPDGAVSVNQRFAALFGAEPGDVLARLGGAGGRFAGGRVVLSDPAGEEIVCRAFAEPAEGGAWELILFPLGPQDQGRTGASKVLDTMPVALAEFDMLGRLLWTNAAARAMLGALAEPGRALDEIVEPLGQPIATILSEAADRVGEGTAMVRMKGADAFLQISLSPVEIDQSTTMFAVLIDASELRRLEEKFAQSQKMEAIGKLAGGVAHDFNNVLTAIAGHCDLLLLRKDQTHPDYPDLMQIAQNSNRAAALVRQLLAFSRKQTLKPVKLDIRDVVSDAHYLLDRLVGEQVALETDFGDDLWHVRADAQQLEQVLMNLVINARDAMAGRGRIDITCQNLSLDAPARRNGLALPRGDYVEIVVSDTGPGIAEDALDKVFDPFFSTKAKGEGTGLGLSTVYGIVKQSGGYIAAENLEEGGAAFIIRLPRAGRELSAAPMPAAVPPEPERVDLTGSGSVMLVEDEDPVRAFAARALKLRGYSVLEADSAEAAMELLSDPDCRVDLLVSDVVMPGMDGPTFAREARRLRPGLRLIFVSGYAEESFRKNLTERDFHFLAKPFSLDELTGLVKRALQQEEAA